MPAIADGGTSITVNQSLTTAVNIQTDLNAMIAGQSGNDWRPTDLALFHSPDDTRLTLDLTASVYVQADDNWDVHSRSQAGAIVTLHYVYDPHGTPLPATVVPKPPVRLLLGLEGRCDALAHRRQHNRE